MCSKSQLGRESNPYPEREVDIGYNMPLLTKSREKDGDRDAPVHPSRILRLSPRSASCDWGVPAAIRDGELTSRLNATEVAEKERAGHPDFLLPTLDLKVLLCMTAFPEML